MQQYLNKWSWNTILLKYNCLKKLCSVLLVKQYSHHVKNKGIFCCYNCRHNQTLQTSFAFLWFKNVTYSWILKMPRLIKTTRTNSFFDEYGLLMLKYKREHKVVKNAKHCCPLTNICILSENIFDVVS